ncbi:type II secretion system protein [Desulfobulbus alkaliphilus]|uniref:type II secretion system protein n=1 Tax=Desulfobulbus alkaliphilus TaxID=869814 RepID=UPI00196509C8|nr:type II secretion system protein [Desulfobulbus alkaliphilus]MBM9536571.1 type II secretion system protein [Desulfobulbus alkaliphilus]
MKPRQHQDNRPGITGQGGYSLVEVLVVLAILGFLIAMTSPRLAGTIARGLEITTRTNMARLGNFLTHELQQNRRYPTGMINIVSVDGADGSYHKPMVSDQDPGTGPEVLSERMDRRHGLRIHYLDAAEAEELRQLGVLYVFNLNSPYDRDVAVGMPRMQPVEVGVAVLMTGGGFAADGTFDLAAEEADRAHPQHLFRMLFGLGTETSLVRDGMVFNAPTCPESGLRPINYGWQYYSLVLPRLAATSARLEEVDPLGSGGQVTAYAVSGRHEAAALQTVMRRTVQVYQPQRRGFFSVMDAEGGMWTRDEPPTWGIDINGNGAID